ncbi:MAG TPA: MBL fold metallo-hydrolase, partial [Solirubrobacterales bacterium]
TKSRHIDVISSRRRAFRRAWVAGAAGAAVVVLAWAGSGVGASGPASGLRVTFLDVGQGDAILLQPARGPAVLVDGGPPGDDLATKLRAAGVSSLGVAVVTHEQSDHAGGIEELLGRFPVAELAYARIGRRLRGEAEAAGVAPVRIAAGGVLRAGRLELEVLWPPRELLAAPLAGIDPNAQALVLLVRWGHFSLLLSADAEAEAVPVDPGPVDVLKVAHHGSEDTGLDSLLDRTDPRLAVISVGEDNPFGHPTPATLQALAAHRIPILRTDLDGTISLGVSRGSVGVDTNG